MRALTLLALLVGGCGDAATGGDGGNPGGDGSSSPDAFHFGDGGASIFPPDNAWNTDVSGAPIDPMSAQYIASIGLNTGLHPDFSSIAGGNYGIPYVEVPPDQPLVPVTFTLYPDESDPGPYPIPDNAPIEGNGVGDAHVIVVDRGNGFLYELYHGAHPASGWTADNGAKWNLASNAGRMMHWTSADAAGLPIFPGLARYDEVAAGAIDHALRFTVSSSQKGYVAPASHAAGSCALGSSCPPMGLRVRLKASFDVSGFQPQSKVILTALKKYGMIVADNGSDWYISGAPAAGWNDDDLHTLGQVTGNDFEVVAAGPITPQ